MRRVLLAVQLLVLTAGLSACGGDTLSLDPVASAATKTAESGSSRVGFAIAMKVAGESIHMSGSGAFDFREPRGSLTYRMELPELGDVRMDMRLVGAKLYLRLPKELTGAIAPGGKQWLGIDLGASLERAGLSGLDFTQQQDPAQALRFLRAASADVKEAGSATVKGVRTTRYVGRLDLRRALDQGLDRLELPEAERQKARAGMEAMLDQLGSNGLPFEVFVGADGLLRRLTMDLRLKMGGESIGMAVRMDYFDFGVEVDVEAPPARDVFDATGLLRP